MITMDNIVREGHPALRKIAKAVEVPTTEQDILTLNNMLIFLKNSQDDVIAEQYNLRSGVGLAAPQIGINKQLVAIHFEDLSGKLYSYGLINPKIVSHSVEEAYLSAGEGCLSVDRNIEGFVVRYARITVNAIDVAGNKLKLRLKDYAAIVFQHEIDHLNGIMFYDHINKQDPYATPQNAKAIE